MNAMLEPRIVAARTHGPAPEDTPGSEALIAASSQGGRAMFAMPYSEPKSPPLAPLAGTFVPAPRLRRNQCELAAASCWGEGRAIAKGPRNPTRTGLGLGLSVLSFCGVLRSGAGAVLSSIF